MAQLVYDNAPMPTGSGVVQGPEYTDNFAQRNLQITYSDNPGPRPRTACRRPSMRVRARPLGSSRFARLSG